MMKQLLSKAWDAVANPKSVTIAMTFGYALLLLQGVMNFTHPLVEGIAVDVVRVLVNILLISGGVLGAVACYRGLWLFERPAMLMAATAYAVHLIWVLCDLDGDGIIEQGKAVRMALVLIFLYTRFERIRGSLVDPNQREAT